MVCVGGAMQVTYSFWLYDLCDVYIELIKVWTHPPTHTRLVRCWLACSSLIKWTFWLLVVTVW